MTDEIPQLPKNWILTTVGNIYEVVGGGTPSTANNTFWEGTIPWISSADIYGLKEIQPRKFITKEAIRNSATNLVPEGSLIVVTRVGLGKVALAPYSLCFSQDSQALIGNNNLVSPIYSLFFLSQAVQSFKYKHRGTTIAGVPKSQLNELTFPLPPFAEQVRIVSKIEELFSRLDAGVKALQQTQQQLEQYRQSILRQAFTGKLTEKWRENNQEIENASILLVKIISEINELPNQRFKTARIENSSLPDLPEKWIWVNFGKAFYINFGQSPPSTSYNDIMDGLPFFQGSKEFQEYYPVIKKWCNKPNKIAEKDDILISVRAPVGDVNIAPSKCCIGRGLAAIRSVASIDKMYIYYLIKYIQKDLDSLGTGTTFRAITGSVLYNYPIPLPPLKEIEEIVKELKKNDSITKNNLDYIKESLKIISTLKQSILKSAFEGRLVPQDPNDEPASMLLEKIKVEKASGKPSRKCRKSRGQMRLVE